MHIFPHHSFSHSLSDVLSNPPLERVSVLDAAGVHFADELYFTEGAYFIASAVILIRVLALPFLKRWIKKNR
jgi:hypothetical protein